MTPPRRRMHTCEREAVASVTEPRCSLRSSESVSQSCRWPRITLSPAPPRTAAAERACCPRRCRTSLLRLSTAVPTTHTHTSYMHTRAPHAWTGRTQGHNNSNSSGSSSSKPRNDDGNDNSNRAAAQQQQRTLKERIDVAVARSLQLEVHLRELFPTDELFALQQEHAQSM